MGAGSGGGAGGGGGDLRRASSAPSARKEPVTPHSWLCSRQPRVLPLGFLPRFGRDIAGKEGGVSGSGVNRGVGVSGGSNGRVRTGSRGGTQGGGKGGGGDGNFRRHYTTSSRSARATDGSGSSSSGSMGAARAREASGRDTKLSGTHKAVASGSSEVGGVGSGAGIGSRTRAASGVRSSPSLAHQSAGGGSVGRRSLLFAGFGSGGRSRSTARGKGRTSRARGGAWTEGEQEEAQAVPLQLEDEGMLQEQGWVYPPKVCLLLAMSNDPEDPNSKGEWVEMDEGDTIFKCVSVLLSQAPAPAPQESGISQGTSAWGAGAGTVEQGGRRSSTQSSFGRSNGLREGLIGLRRSLVRDRIEEHVIYFRTMVRDGPTSVGEGRKTGTGARIPSEKDIHSLSPGLADALILTRLIRGLCERHPSSLAA
ncbi:unnamed protein product, partial [Choristocarpus tenellus]